MEADISDAPDRVIRRRQKRSGLYIAFCLVIASAATTGAFQLITRTATVASTLRQAVSPNGRGEVGADASAMRQGQSLDSSWVRAPDAQLPAGTAGQTVFNDRNYIPRGAVNVVAFPAGKDLSPDSQPPKVMKLTIVRQSPSMKDRACWPFKQGSIESRNCRASVGLNHRD